MNFFELINRCLAELGLEESGSFDGFGGEAHIYLKKILNRINSKICEACFNSGYYCAVDKDGNYKQNMEAATDKSIIPGFISSDILTYGACLEYKCDPAYSKFAYWYGMYCEALKLFETCRKMNIFLPDTEIINHKDFIRTKKTGSDFSFPPC